MPKVLIATIPYQGQITINGGESMMSPVWVDIKDEVKVATQNQLQGCEFDHWKINGQKISQKNPETVIVTKDTEEIFAVFKKV